MSADPHTGAPPPVDPGSSGDAVDPAVLGALAARLGERAGGFLLTLLDTWELETSQRLGELDRAITEGKLAGVARVAHSLRGSSAAMGAMRLSEVCGQVELAARSDEPVDLSAAHALLAAEVSMALSALSSLHRSGNSNDPA